MYVLKTRSDFDSAHFLKGYEGKCANIHGHHWLVEIQIRGEEVKSEGPHRGMLVDFSDLKEDLREETSRMDHALLYEAGSLKEKTLEALREEGFLLIEFPFRPTAENFAKHFYDYMTSKGYDVARAEVYETLDNCAIYEGENHD